MIAHKDTQELIMKLNKQNLSLDRDSKVDEGCKMCAGTGKVNQADGEMIDCICEKEVEDSDDDSADA